MHSILIAHRDVGFAEHLAALLRASGYLTVVTCPGPWPPQRCIRCDKGYYPLTEGAELMIYDPQSSTSRSSSVSATARSTGGQYAASAGSTMMVPYRPISCAKSSRICGWYQ
jgi:hypothetical protein